MKLIYTFTRFWMLAVVVLVLLGCRINGQRLRGNTILALRLPIQVTQEEIVSLSDEHVASRTFVPITVGTPINRVIVSDPLWTELEDLRQRWCTQPPAFVSLTPNDADYRIIVKCEQADEDPSYFVHPTDLPPQLHALLDLVPSTSERVIPQ